MCLYEGPKPTPEMLKPYLGVYRGTILLTRSGSAWYVINRVDIEEYLYGVVAKEMGVSWPEEALKAQAVCSRTFVARKMLEVAGSGLPFDIRSSSFHQVFGACEDERVISAVDATAGEVLVGGTQPVLFPVYFHACCGGRTSTPQDVWGGPGVEGAVSVECAGCGSPYAAWSRTIPKRFLAAALGLPSVVSVQIDRRDSAGRMQDLKVRAGDGTLLSVSVNRLRLALYARAGDQSFGNPRTLPSTLCTVEDTGDAVRFRGSGFGHGVGMCQEGARKMAEEGRTYREILARFFPYARLGILQQRGDVHGDTAVLNGAG